MTAPRSRDLRFLRRRDLFDKLMHSLSSAVSAPSGQRRDLDRAYLEQSYGTDELELVLRAIRARFERLQGDRDPDKDDAHLYGRYVAAYNRYGGSTPFLSFEEEQAHKREATKLRFRTTMMATGLPPLSPAERARLDELDALLLTDNDLWEGIFPDDPPPEPREAVLPPALQRRLDKRPRRRR